ncbi:MAG: STAS/SEC14 domain-containing protein [Solirubrobacterales bacterium]
MIERIENMPPGTIGLRASGKITRDDYRTVLEPALRDAVEAGEVRLLYVVEGDFEMRPGAVFEDAMTGARLGIAHHSAWKRMALVTDSDWVRRAVHAFAWMTPGEIRIWGLNGIDEAREWLAA